MKKSKSKNTSGSTRSRLSVFPGPNKPLLCEVAWEVCRRLGGIYTVIRSKAPVMTRVWKNRYCLVGPYDPATSDAEFEESRTTGFFARAVKILQKEGLEAHYGTWLITGRPKTVLLNPASVLDRLDEIKYFFWKHHGIEIPADDTMLNEIVAFAYMVQRFFIALANLKVSHGPIIGHFHEWMASAAIPELRRLKVPIAIAFHTHATMLGRFISTNDPWFYDHVPFIDWEEDAKKYGIEPQVRLERAAAHGAHTLTTLSEITAFECERLLGKKPDLLLPNGLNIERFVAMHEFQNLHRLYKEQIHQFVMSHFFPSYSFDLDKTLYFFSSGRYEYRNKGYDLTIESLARLNRYLKMKKTDQTIVFFLVTRRPFKSINAEVLRTKAVMAEMRSTCQAIKDEFGEHLFASVARRNWPKFDDLVGDFWRLRLRRMMHEWKAHRLPAIVTHDLEDDGGDEVLQQLRECNLINRAEDPVKVVYHPDFIEPSNPLFGMDYDQFVRGCHLGIFPSSYEPWGYTPLECMARGVPAITSDLSGFGTYVIKHLPDHDQNGLFVTHRRNMSFDDSAEELFKLLVEFTEMGQRDRISQRNLVERSADHFDWDNLSLQYDKAQAMAFAKVFGA